MSLSLLVFLRSLLPNLGSSNSATDGSTLRESNFAFVLVWDLNSRFMSFLNYLSHILAFFRRHCAGEIIDRLRVRFLALRSRHMAILCMFCTKRYDAGLRF